MNKIYSPKEIEKKYSSATFVGYQHGDDLVRYLASADVFVFPSYTDTFGLAVVEALACGVPVAAHDVMGPRDIITHGVDGFLGDNLQEAAEKCLALSREACRAKALCRANCQRALIEFSFKHTAQTTHALANVRGRKIESGKQCLAIIDDVIQADTSGIQARRIGIAGGKFCQTATQGFAVRQWIGIYQ